MKAVQLKLSGRVQGVGMRYWVVQQARALDLCGWVRNEPDGSVKVWIEGEDHTVDALVNLCETSWLSGRPGYIESVGKLAVTPVGEERFATRWG